MTIRLPGTLAALALGVAAGMRTATPAAALVVRRRLLPAGARWAVVAAAAGEAIADKHPDVPDRRTPPALAGRLASGAGCGWIVDGARGAVIGGAAAVSSTVATAGLRGRAVDATGLPDPAVAVAEDLVAVGLSTLSAAPAPSRWGRRRRVG